MRLISSYRSRDRHRMLIGKRAEVMCSRNGNFDALVVLVIVVVHRVNIYNDHHQPTETIIGVPVVGLGGTVGRLQRGTFRV